MLLNILTSITFIICENMMLSLLRLFIQIPNLDLHIPSWSTLPLELISTHTVVVYGILLISHVEIRKLFQLCLNFLICKMKITKLLSN